MKSFIRSALLGAAGLVALSLSAHAAGTTTVTDSPLVNVDDDGNEAHADGPAPLRSERGQRRLQEVEEEEGEEEVIRIHPKRSVAPSAEFSPGQDLPRTFLRRAITVRMCARAWLEACAQNPGKAD